MQIVGTPFRIGVSIKTFRHTTVTMVDMDTSFEYLFKKVPTSNMACKRSTCTEKHLAKCRAIYYVRPPPPQVSSRPRTSFVVLPKTFLTSYNAKHGCSVTFYVLCRAAMFHQL